MFSFYFPYREIQERIGKPHRNLLYVYGWLIPEPGIIHVLMEKADSDVTTALQQGLSLKTRMKIALDVINGIKAVHTALYIHQDIKADSILVSVGFVCVFNKKRRFRGFVK